MPTSTLELACELVRRPSITPEDAGCQDLLAGHLHALGFRVRSLPFGEVSNLWARRGTKPPLFVFLGHTDVVPPGPKDAWSTHPFEPVLKDGYLHGRGSADMKGSLAAMVTACARFTERHPAPAGSIALLVTSDEEGPARDGTRRVVDTLSDVIDWCVVGEPSSTERVGDTIKHGRRGSLNGRLAVHGVQGHVAYPERTVNPIHGACAAIAEILGIEWDEGSDDFPPTRFQVSNIRSGTGAVNVVPATLEADFNLRYSPALDDAVIRARVETVLERHGLRWSIEWEHSAAPFITRGGRLVEAAKSAVREVSGVEPTLSTAGGTSDGRFVAPTGAEVIELGPVNATIHQVDERVACADLDRLSRMYEGILDRLLATPDGNGAR
ncbi:MAG: succinyl-diaminopimelate desuccinylase [Immundisolibacterales bacterium]|nr:succinyl-diaminopimelate desuccinylase [Immundisolibacterales bacterium]